jgi:hypothetical protein
MAVLPNAAAGSAAKIPRGERTLVVHARVIISFD